ncbi:MAG: FkbM family methyltransferase [Halioglobus sp.]|nr:FkbM family methyltransferase [Halioglobus sp.]
MSTAAVRLTPTAGDRPLTLCVHDERDQYVSRRLREEGVWEPYETELVLAALAPGDVFVDAGANIGYFSILAAARVGASGAVFAFEPDPANAALLRESARSNALDGIITVVEAALAQEAGSAALFLSSDNLGDHQLFAGDEDRESVAVTMVNGAQYLAPFVRDIAMVKVDTQGFEYEVLAGLMPLLRELPRTPRLLVELTPYSLAQAGSSGRELVELLASLGQPMWIVDHLEHRLAASDAAALATWCDNVAATPGDQGFMNILVGPALP